MFSIEKRIDNQRDYFEGKSLAPLAKKNKETKKTERHKFTAFLSIHKILDF